MSAPKTFRLRQIIAVRVGAEVEITSFYKPKTSLWEGAITGHEADVLRDEVVLRDLESGVVYGADWHFQDAELDPRLVVAETVRGRVLACQIRSSDRSSEFRVDTWLAIEPGASGAYR